jgi:hypothetical protein
VHLTRTMFALGLAAHAIGLAKDPAVSASRPTPLRASQTDSPTPSAKPIWSEHGSSNQAELVRPVAEGPACGVRTQPRSRRLVDRNNGPVPLDPDGVNTIEAAPTQKAAAPCSLQIQASPD